MRRYRPATEQLGTSRGFDGSAELERLAQELELLTAHNDQAPLSPEPDHRESDDAAPARRAPTIVHRASTGDPRPSSTDDVPAGSRSQSKKTAPHFKLAADSAAELLRNRAVQDEVENQDDHESESATRRWTWRDLIPDVIYGLASDRTLAIIAATIVAAGAIAGGIWWGPFGNADTPDAGLYLRPSGVRGFIASLSLAGDGTLAAGRTMGQIEIWDTTTQQLIESLELIRGKHVALSADGARLLAGDERQSRGYSLTTRAVILRDRGIRSLTANTAGTHAVSLDMEGDAIVWNLAAGKVEATLSLNRSRDVTAIAVGPEGRQCAVGTRTGRILLIDVDSADVLREIVINRSGAVTALSIGATADRIAAITADHRLHVFHGQLHDKDWDPPLALGNQFTSRVHWLDENRILTAGGCDLAVCAPQTGPQTWGASVHWIDALAISPDGRIAAVGCHDESAIVVFDLTNQQRVATLDIQQQ